MEDRELLAAVGHREHCTVHDRASLDRLEPGAGDPPGVQVHRLDCGVEQDRRRGRARGELAETGEHPAGRCRRIRPAAVDHPVGDPPAEQAHRPGGGANRGRTPPATEQGAQSRVRRRQHRHRDPTGDRQVERSVDVQPTWPDDAGRDS